MRQIVSMLMGFCHHISQHEAHLVEHESFDSPNTTSSFPTMYSGCR
jgi:hypothetical protein